MADLRALGALLRTARERTGMDLQTFCGASRRATPDGFCCGLWSYDYAEGYEDGILAPDAATLVIYARACGLPAAPDAWFAAAGLVPPDVEALAADPERWATLRAADALRELYEALTAKNLAQRGADGAYLAHARILGAHQGGTARERDADLAERAANDRLTKAERRVADALAALATPRADTVVDSAFRAAVPYLPKCDDAGCGATAARARDALVREMEHPVTPAARSDTRDD